MGNQLLSGHRLFGIVLPPPLDNQPLFLHTQKYVTHSSNYNLYSCFASSSHALTGKVISIADGDTITILDSAKKQHKIRLYGIDCPEGGQPFGKAAKKLTAKLTARKTVTVTPYDTDRYGRTVGFVQVDGVNVNESLIRAGYAWQYRKYCKAEFCRDWLQEEKEALPTQTFI